MELLTDKFSWFFLRKQEVSITQCLKAKFQYARTHTLTGAYVALRTYMLNSVKNHREEKGTAPSNGTKVHVWNSILYFFFCYLMINPAPGLLSMYGCKPVSHNCIVAMARLPRTADWKLNITCGLEEHFRKPMQICSAALFEALGQNGVMVDAFGPCVAGEGRM